MGGGRTGGWAAGPDMAAAGGHGAGPLAPRGGHALT